MSMVDMLHIQRLQERLDRLEAVARARKWHEPSCPVEQTRVAQKRTDMYLYSPPCNCWLSDGGPASEAPSLY